MTAIVAVVAFYALSPDRLPKLATGLITAAGSIILIAAILHRAAVRNNLTVPGVISQRHQMMALLIVVCVGVALAQIGVGLAARYASRPGCRDGVAHRALAQLAHGRGDRGAAHG